MSSFFELKDLIWAVIGAIIGWLLPELIKKCFDTYKKNKNAKRIKLINDTYIKSDELISPLSHGFPFFERKTLVLNEPVSEFHFSMPEDIHKRICEKNANFDHTDWDSDLYWGMTDDSILLKKIVKACDSKVDEYKIREILELKKVEVAEIFEARANQAFFNGELYGIDSIQDSRKGNEEKAVVTVKSVKTDYYTHRVMAAVYQHLLKEKMISEPTGMEDINNYSPFLTAMGMDVLLVIEDKKKVVLAKRSKQLINMKEDKWHLSVNEAISITDILYGKISLDTCVLRGLKEELGIFADSINIKFDIHYGDLFFLRNPLEIGITAFVVADDLTETDVRNGYNIAQDAPYESTGNDKTGLTFVKFADKEISDFCKNNKVTPAAAYCLKMLEVRKANL